MSRLRVPSYFSLIYLAFSSATLPLGTTWELASCISAARSPVIRVILRKIHSMDFPIYVEPEFRRRLRTLPPLPARLALVAHFCATAIRAFQTVFGYADFY